MEGQGRFLLEPAPNVTGMPNEPAKAGLLAEQSDKLVRAGASQEPQMGLSLVTEEAAEGCRGPGHPGTDDRGGPPRRAQGGYFCRSQAGKLEMCVKCVSLSVRRPSGIN